MNEFDKWMQSDSSYAVIAQRHPDMIATARLAVTEGFRKSLRQGDNSPAFDASRDAFKTLTATLFKRYAPSMPDEELVNFWRTWFQGIKRVAQGDSSAILATLAGGVGIPADTTANREVGQAGLRGIAAAIRSPAGVSDSVAVEATRAALIARLRTRFGDDVQMLADPLNPAFDRSRSQAVVLTFWDELFALPDHQAGPFIRQFAPMSSLP